MVRKRAFLALMLATSLTGSASAALASGGSASRPTPKGPIVVSLSPQLNGPVAALLFVGDRVLNAVRTATGIGLVKGPIHGTQYETYGIEDGPDPLGVKGGPVRWDPMPASHRVP
jgi:hypothetical protein